MAIGPVGSATGAYVQKTSSSEDVTQLQRQKEMLQRQLENLKSTQKGGGQDVSKQVAALEKRIAIIEQKIQQLQTKQG